MFNNFKKENPMPTATLEAEPIRKPSADMHQTKMLIDGKWVDSVSGRSFETINPATGEVITRIAEGGKEDIERAVNGTR